MPRTICFQHENTKEDYDRNIEIAVRESKGIFVRAVLFDRINKIEVARWSGIPSWPSFPRICYYHELVLFEALK